MMAEDKIRFAALKIGISLEPGLRFGFHNFRHSLATFSYQQGQRREDDSGIASSRQSEHHP